jgi:hypothetical protein
MPPTTRPSGVRWTCSNGYVFERVNRDQPFDGLHWFFDHAETISPESIDRVAALGGGIAVQHRMAYQGEYFVERHGAAAATVTPPLQRMLASGVKLSAGTDATRVASYNPWVSLAWLTSGRTVGGLALYAPDQCLDRETALRLWTERVAWFSNEDGAKGRIAPGLLADLVVPDRDYFRVPEADLVHTTALLTLVGGRVVWATGPFAALDPPPPPVLPEWSPVRCYGGYSAWAARVPAVATACQVHRGSVRAGADVPAADPQAFWGAFGCSCWAF